MATHEVTFPVTDPAEILKLRAGDEVVVQGHVIGIRDRTQIRIFDHGVEPPMDLRGAFLLHTAPNVRKLGLLDANDGYLRRRWAEDGLLAFEFADDTATDYDAYDAVARDRAARASA